MILRNFFIKLSTSSTARSVVTGFGPARNTARRFVAGETLDDAISVAKTLNSRGIKTILNHVGESVSSPDEAGQASKEVQELVCRIADEGLDSTISIKPSHLGLEFGQDFYYENVADIVQLARQHNIFVELDIEAGPDVDDTLAVYHKLLDTFGGGVRQAVQSYLYRTPADVHRIIERGGSIRLVKGAYQESPAIAYQNINEINRVSLKIMDQFLSAQALDRGAYLALGSHDPALIEPLLAEAEARGVRPDQFEIQMLLGIRRDEQQRLADKGYQVRTYVPYGNAWYPYFMRRLAERPANVMFMARAMVGK